MNATHDGLMQGLVTLLAFTSFLGICFYAYSPSRRRCFESAAQLPVLDGAEKQPQNQPEDQGDRS